MPGPAPGAAPDISLRLTLALFHAYLGSTPRFDRPSIGLRFAEDVHRHISAAELDGLLVGVEAEIDAAPADGPADVPRDRVPVPVDMHARPQRDHIGVDGHHAAPGGKPKRGHVANRAPVVVRTRI